MNEKEIISVTEEEFEELLYYVAEKRNAPMFEMKVDGKWQLAVGDMEKSRAFYASIREAATGLGRKLSFSLPTEFRAFKP